MYAIACPCFVYPLQSFLWHLKRLGTHIWAFLFNLSTVRHILCLLLLLVLLLLPLLFPLFLPSQCDLRASQYISITFNIL